MSARADLCGGRSAMIVPTATLSTNEIEASCRIVGKSSTPRSCFDSALVEELILDDEGSHVICRAELGPTQTSLRSHVRP